MKVRVLTAIVGIIAVLCLVWLGGWFLTGAVFLVSLIALAEYDRMLKQLSIRIYRIPAAIAIGAVVLSAGFYSVKVFTAVIFLSFCLLLFLILSIKKEEMTNLVYTSFGSLYFGLGFGTLALLRGSRELLPAGAVNGDPGIFLILFALTHAFFLSLMAAVMAPVGDLFESYIKRACDIKDSGNILPGHGGMMDRFDSLLFVAPSLAAVLALLR